VKKELNQWQTLVDSIVEEDILLRNRLTECSPELREMRSPQDGLSFKETLGHIAFWDDFTIRFFQEKLDRTTLDPLPPVNFEERSRDALRKMAALPFGEGLARYLEATGTLIEFLQANWNALSEREKYDFWVPLKHRRHHRISLFRHLNQASSPESEMAAGA